MTISNTSRIYLNGDLVSPDEARISPFDRGLLFGDGVFETLRAYQGVIFRLDRHVSRMKASLDAVGMKVTVDGPEIRRATNGLLKANGLSDARIRVTITGGLFGGEIRLARTHEPTVIISVTPMQLLTEEQYRKGMTLLTARFRQPWSSLLARVKTTHRLEYLMAREEALTGGAEDALILDDRDGVAEGTGCNLFLVHGNVVTTPGLDGPILPGVTREAALEAASACGYETREEFVPRDRIASADEMFATSTSWEVHSVRSVDGKEVGGGRRGPAATRIHAALRAIVDCDTAATGS